MIYILGRIRGSIDDKNPKIIELSEVLNRLPIHTNRPDIEKFRNPNGVTLKLSNFLAIDPNYSGKRMESYSKLDKEVFAQDKVRLRSLARALRSVSDNAELVREIAANVDDDSDCEVKQKFATRKKNEFAKKHGSLFCEICKFDFTHAYGDIGKGYIECHHISPLASLVQEKNMKLSDLVLVCSNCHRMLHRNMATITVDELITRLKLKPY